MLRVTSDDLTNDFYRLHAAEYAKWSKARDVSHVWSYLDGLAFPDRLVVDLGCGAGRDLREFSRRGLSVVGVDSAMPLLNEARKRSPGVPLICSDITLLPFRDSSIGLIWALASLLHVPKSDMKSTLRGLLRVLLPGGVMLSTMKHGMGEVRVADGRRFSLFCFDEWRDLLLQAGFVVEVQDTEGEPDRSRDVWMLTIARAPG